MEHHEQHRQAADAAAHAELHVLAGQDVVAALPSRWKVRGRLPVLHELHHILSAAAQSGRVHDCLALSKSGQIKSMHGQASKRFLYARER